MAKKIASQPSPGSRSRYGSPAFLSRAATGSLLRADHLLERVVQLPLLLGRKLPEDERVRERLLVREDELVLPQRRIALGKDLLHTIQRADVVNVLGDVSLH